MKRQISIALALALILGTALLAPGSARATTLLPDIVDADASNSWDAFVREGTYMGNQDIGARCDYNGLGDRSIRIRPPAVSTLWGLQSQTVAWEPFIWNAVTGQYKYGSWSYARAYAGGFIRFGGGDDWQSTYWNASQALLASYASGNWYPFVAVAWQNPNTLAWTVRNLQVLWLDRGDGLGGYYRAYGLPC